MRVAERAVGVQRQAAVAGTNDRRGVHRQRVVRQVDVRIAVQQLVPASRSASVAVPPSATVKLSVSATGVLSLTGVIVIVTVAVAGLVRRYR